MNTPLPQRFRLIPMSGRDPRQPHRVASTLELFFDLTFVIAVSTAAGELHHALAEGHVGSGLLTFAMVFFGIWWAWMNFTWFATGFDTDDWLYRVLTIVQMGGVLVLAAGIAPAFAEGNFTTLVVAYVVMRVAMVAQWLRAAGSAAPASTIRRTALTYAAGIAIAQLCWIGFLWIPASAQGWVFLALVLLELAVPVVAERNGSTETGGSTAWHAHHITERYGLFTLIVLGESLLSSATAVITALEEVDSIASVIRLAVLALIVTASLWWIYFWPPHHRAIGSFAQSLSFGYIHYFVFAGAAIFAVGLELEIDRLTNHSVLSPMATSLAVSIPIAMFLMGVWWVLIRRVADRVVNVAIPAAAALVVADALIPIPVALPAVVMIGVVVILVLRKPLVQ